jgi:hypothetical protein
MSSLPICWDPNRVREVINTDAESISDAVFRAVHSEHVLQIAEPFGTSFQQLRSAAFRDMQPQDFLAEFLRPDRPHAQVAVIGRSGSGKSHLIHWMRSHIRATATRMVLVIPKAGTSLRAVLDLVLKQLPPEQQRPFRDQLDMVGDTTATRDGQKQRLINEIAQSIRDDTLRSATGDDAEIEEGLLASLPHVFQDPDLRRRYFLGDDSIVASIVDHVFAAPNAYKRTDERRGFGVEDLPVGGRDYADASKLAREALDLIYLDEDRYKALAVEIINRNLNTAIARTLSFSGDRLIELMLAVRKHLKARGQELVLLIEDFARLQGIDRALLQALLTQGDDVHCRIRWAIAVTTGFFESIAETVYTRMTFFIDMDRSVGRSASGEVDERALATFASRYLNAVRLGSRALTAWHETAQASDTPPNACEACSYRSRCHAAFGTHDDVGLYPFTSTALWEMLDRADENRVSGLNPRILQNSVLARILDTHAPALQQAAFPPRALLDALGGPRHLLASDRARLVAAVPADHDRLLTTLELWMRSDTLRDIPDGIREAFTLPALPQQLTAQSSTSIPKLRDGNTEPLTKKERNASVNATDPELEALEAWARGNELPQGLAQRLREQLFDLIAAAIDWDAVGLQRSFYVGASGTKPFKRNSLHLLRQETPPQPASVRLTIPGEGAGEEEFVRVATALQGLLLSNRMGGEWEFPGGAEKLVILLNLLDGWIIDVTRQLRELPRPTTDWRPSEAICELLAIGAALSGRMKSDSAPAEIISAMLTTWPPEPAASSSELITLYKRLADRRSSLIEAFRSMNSASKGGAVGALIDPTSALAVMRLRRDKWRISQTPPASGTLRTSEFQELATLYRTVAADLPGAATAERDRRLAWLASVNEAFGEGTRRVAIQASFVQLREDAMINGFARSRTDDALKTALEGFVAVQFDDAMTAATTLAREEDALASLVQYGRGRSNAMEATTSLIKAAEAFLVDAETGLSNRVQELSLTAQTLDGDVESIRTSLEALSQIAVRQGGPDAP